MALLSPILILSGLGILFGLGLGYAAIKINMSGNLLIPLVREHLPSANCGGCGYPGCDAFAAALVSGEVLPVDCPVCSDGMIDKLCEILSLQQEIAVRKTAFIHCAGCASVSKRKYSYQGFDNCGALASLAGGSRNCSYGCLGQGSCANVCQFDAIVIRDGLAVVDETKCTACGKCVKICPKKLIELIPIKNTVKIACLSNDTGKTVRQNCNAGCIACTLCQKACKYGALIYENNLPSIDYEKCVSCGDCAEKCPAKIIIKQQ